ncbi:DUF488 domain-containing protein [Flavihumibacter sp. R14]|nr:DUF488 domain-containing protein [Flavihumibacter soli]
MKIVEPAIWTIGHSTRSIEEFLSIFRSFEIKLLADVRHFPGSRKFPHFNKQELKESLAKGGIDYLAVPELGGRRKPRPDSPHTAWRNEAFRGYADHMGTEDFREGILQLTGLALVKRTAYMCSEAVWWRCHRALISDHLKAKGWKVMHIMKKDHVIEHPFTSVYLSQQDKQNVKDDKKV